MNTILDQLNSQQREAVEYIDGPSLVIAGAGSGKTRVLTYKIVYLLQQGYNPLNILSLTFTNKAAREMKERIAKLIGWQQARYLWMGTFHSVFSRILRTEAERIGFTSNFTIYDSADSRNLVKSIIKGMMLDDKIYKPAKVQSTISRAKNALISPGMYRSDKELVEYDTRSKVPAIKEIYAEYNRRLKLSNAMDFDDLLFFTNRLFRDHPDVLKTYQERFQYILVDEYQDTNFAQYQVIRYLAESHQRVCVVGDDAQSIYSFRGANIDNILKYTDIYPSAKLFKLEQNYRSTQTIVNAANSLIKHNNRQITKTVFSENIEGERIEVVSAYSDFEEGMIVANKLSELRRNSEASYSDSVILYRTNAQSRVFEESLRKKNIPYRIYGGLSFYQRKEIKDVIAYFRMVVNPFDQEALRRVINFPTRGIGDTSQAKVFERAQQLNMSHWDVLSNPLEYNLNVNAGMANKLKGFYDLINSFIEQLHQLSAYELASLIVKQTGIAKDAYQDQTPEGMSRQENLEELLSGIHTFCDTRREEGNEAVGLMDFLSEVSLLSDQDTDKEADSEKVTMMTIHAAKGLEFKNVFVVGLEEDLFPSQMAKNEMNGLEEERRLFYVALTRAEEFCMLTHAQSRFKHGQMDFCNPSRFLKDIDSAFLKSAGGIKDSVTRKTDSDYSTPNSQSLHSNKQFGAKFPTSTTSQNTVQKTTRPSPNFVITKIAQPKLSASTETDKVKIGNVIKHDRFGIGKVTDISGDVDSRKATVEFENSGFKQLLLKFARFEIID